jgi:acetyl esterase/lipase
MRIKKPAFLPVLLFPVIWVLAGCGSDGKDKSAYYENLPYGAHARQVLDLSYPQAPNKITEPLTAVLLIHGGSWIGGSKAEEPFKTYFNELPAKTGAVAATMNHRTLFSDPPAYYDDMLEDVGNAIKLIRDKSGELGVDIDKIVLAGHSSGGHLALLYSYRYHAQSAIPIAFVAGLAPPSDLLDPDMYDPGNLAAEPPEPNQMGIAFSIGISYLTGLIPVTVAAKGDFISGISGNPEKLIGLYMNAPLSLISHPTALDDNASKIAPASPKAQAAAGVPPTVLFHGKKDTTVLWTNSESLEKELRNKGVKVEYHAYEDEGHGFENKRPAILEVMVGHIKTGGAEIGL